LFFVGNVERVCSSFEQDPEKWHDVDVLQLNRMAKAAIR
jgi:hypothetical protein